MYDVLIAGAGVIGGMLARELSRYQLKVCMLEKQNDVACGASKANSGIVHGGFDPEPGTLKAKLNIAGVEKLFTAAKELHVPCLRNGSLVCAFGPEEEPAVRELYNRGLLNGVPNMRILSGEQAREIEPELSKDITLVLDIPTAGIICPYELTVAAIGNAMDNGADLKTEFAVAKVEKQGDVFTVTAENGQTAQGKYFVNCAGAASDKVAALCGDDFFTIIPRAGEYMLLDKAEGTRVSHTIFQVPSKEGKGILVSPTVDGNLLTGPTAGVVASAEDKQTTQSGLDTIFRLAAKSVPGVQFRQVITSFSGVRSSEKNGDFIIQNGSLPGVVQVAAIDSPGLSSCVSIAEYVVELLTAQGLALEANPTFNPLRDDPHAFRKMNDDEKNAYIAEHPDYGKIICRCETVSEGEIRDAIRRNPPAKDVDGVKRRTRSGMGRCQGGFCAPFVMRCIAEENGLPLEQVTKKGAGSNMVVGKL